MSSPRRAGISDLCPFSAIPLPGVVETNRAECIRTAEQHDALASGVVRQRMTAAGARSNVFFLCLQPPLAHLHLRGRNWSGLRVATSRLHIIPARWSCVQRRRVVPDSVSSLIMSQLCVANGAHAAVHDRPKLAPPLSRAILVCRSSRLKPRRGAGGASATTPGASPSGSTSRVGSKTPCVGA
jgi:hypothetical protein